ncbi:MAG: DUF6440 family protein [Oscillibacter sp.]|nr:DUF6440 family protein [Oscillibacter sp.]
MAMAKRFIKVESEGTMQGNEIWVDRVTGVNYLYHFSGYGGGMTPLLNADGTPVVTPIPPED